MPGPVLHIRSLGAHLAKDFAVVIEALDLNPGERLVMDAVSGAGKSTALGLISGGLASSGLQGEIHEICGVSVPASARRSDFARPEMLGFVLQTNTLVPYISVAENIHLPARITGLTTDVAWQSRLLDLLGLEPLLARYPEALSVGQRQRVSVARALLARPALLLLDEPVASLDPGNVAQVETLISHLAEEAGSGILLASHQAQTGVFADVPRVSHRVLSHEGVTYSLFKRDGGATKLNEVA
jgi:putative ABC transport system ATP-binding protein